MLTHENSKGWYLDGVDLDEISEGCVLNKETADAIRKAICRLNEYESTGLEPDKVEAVNSEIAVERARSDNLRDLARSLLEKNSKYELERMGWIGQTADLRRKLNRIKAEGMTIGLQLPRKRSTDRIELLKAISKDVNAVMRLLIDSEYSLDEARMFSDLIKEKISEALEYAPRRISLEDGISEAAKDYPDISVHDK